MAGRKEREKPKPEPDPPAPLNPAVEDQAERGYYYDDAHGYKKYDPKIEDQDDESAPGSNE